MSDPLATYLHDHLAGSHFAIHLLDSLREQHEGESLGEFARKLCADVKDDQDILQEIINHVGKTHLDLMQTVGWLVEKASEFKLHRHSAGGLGTFEAIETIALGIQGKLALWTVMPEVREIDHRVPAYDFTGLAARAKDQYRRVDDQRLQLVQRTFKPSPQNHSSDGRLSTDCAV